jgi:EmrB/QacA subfamily drug resistance transporter
MSLERRAYPLRWWTLVVLSISLVIIGLDNTILNVAIPTIQSDLNASASALQWIVDAYVLVFAGLLLTMGALGDRFGRKRALQAGLVVFGLSSFFAAYAQTASQLIAARALMGIGGALIMLSTLSIITAVFPREERGRAIGIWTGVAALGVGVGPLLGGWLLEHFWWGSVFFINIPVVVVALLAGAIIVPESRDPMSRRIDVPGAVLSIASLSALIFAIIEAPTRGWLDGVVIAAFGAAVLLGAGFVRHELRTDQPMLDLGLFGNPRFSAGVTSITIAFFGLYGTIFVVTQYLQFVLGYSALKAGLAITPLALGMLIGASNSHRLVDRFGTGKVVAGGLTVIALTLATFSFWSAATPYWVIGLSVMVLAIGLANTMAPSTDAVMGAVPVAKAGVGSAMNDTTRQVGGALGIAILGSVLNSLYASRMTQAVSGLPAQAQGPASDSVGAAMRIANRLDGAAGEALAAAARGAFIDAMGTALLVASGLAIAGALLALKFMPARHLTETPVEMTRRPEPAGGARLTPSRSMATEPVADREEVVL